MPTMIEEKMNIILKACKDCAEIKEALLIRAMVYQVDSKEQAALDNGLPINAYYGLSFSDWSVIRADIAADNKAQSDHCERVALWLELDEFAFYDIPFYAWRDFWEAYKSEGLAGEIDQQELQERSAKASKRYWTVTVPALEAERERQKQALGSCYPEM